MQTFSLIVSFLFEFVLATHTRARDSKSYMKGKRVSAVNSIERFEPQVTEVSHSVIRAVELGDCLTQAIHVRTYTKIQTKQNAKSLHDACRAAGHARVSIKRWPGA